MRTRVDMDDRWGTIGYVVLAIYQLGLIIWLFTDEDMPRITMALVVTLAVLGWVCAGIVQQASKEHQS